MKVTFNSKGFSVIETMLFLIILVLVAGAAYYVGGKQSDKKPIQTTGNTTGQQEAKQTASKSDDEQITEALRNKINNQELGVIVRQHEGNFAKGTAGFEDSGGFSFIAVKQNGKWEIIYTGQELPSKAEGEKYGMPTSWYSTDY